MKDYWFILSLWSLQIILGIASYLSSQDFIGSLAGIGLAVTAIASISIKIWDIRARKLFRARGIEPHNSVHAPLEKP
jgi:hypothetical protein